MIAPFRLSLVLIAALATGLATAPRAQIDVRFSGTAAFLGEGDTSGLLASLASEAPLASTSLNSPVRTHLRVFGGASALRSGTDFYETNAFEETGSLGYGRRTLLMAEAGLAIQAGWVRLAAGPSIRYRDESFVQSARLNQEVGLYEATVVEHERTDVGGLVELGVQLPLSEAVAMGVHASLRSYDAGTQMGGLGLSTTVAL